MTHDILGIAGDIALALIVACLAVLIVGSIFWSMHGR